jgi:hypothetical protein
VHSTNLIKEATRSYEISVHFYKPKSGMSSADNNLHAAKLLKLVTVHLYSRLTVTGAGYSSGTWIPPRDYTGGSKPPQ